MTPSLTLNLGARYEFYTVPKEKNGLDAYLPDLLTSTDTVLGGPFVNPSKRNLAPRVGFAWDLTGDGRTAVRGGTGIYYDTDNPFNSSLGISAFTPPFAPAVTVSGPGIRFPNPSFEPSPGARTLRTVDYHVSSRGVDVRVNLQRDLAGHWAVMVGSTRARAGNLIQTYEEIRWCRPSWPTAHCSSRQRPDATRPGHDRFGECPAGIPHTTRSSRR